MNIAFNNFVTNSFINELKHEGISEIFIEDFLNKILNNNGIIQYFGKIYRSIVYKQEIEKIYNIAFKYMKYNKSCLQKDIQILGR